MSRSLHRATAPQRRRGPVEDSSVASVRECAPLERRLLFAGFFSVTGTEADDQILVEISGDLVVANVNGTITSVLDADVGGILVNALGGHDSIRIDSNGDNLTTLNGGLGDDTIDLAPESQQMSDIDSFVMANGDAGSDLLVLNSANSTADLNYHVTGAFIGRSDGESILPRCERLSIFTGSGADVFDNIGFGNGPFLLNAGAGTDTVNIQETGSFSTGLTLTPSSGDDIVGVSVDDAGVSKLTLVAQRLGSLSIHAGGRVRLVESEQTPVLVTAALSITGTGFLDAQDNHVVVDYTGASPLAAVQAALISGYAGGAWNGPGIHSANAATTGNTALGYGEATDLFTTFPATFVGQQVDATSVLVRYTHYGDASLDGTVNLDDFNRLVANFGGANRRWTHGDFDFDLRVNLTDFNRLASNFGQTVTARGALASIRSDLDDDDDERADVADDVTATQ